MMKTLIGLLVLGACVDEPVDNGLEDTLWHNDTPVHVMTDDTMPTASREAFKRRVKTDINRWRDALLAVGCPAPFHYVDDDIDDPIGAVRLVPNERWTGGAVGKWSWGVVTIRAEGDGTLDTYADDPTWIVGLHELGHALGLEHSEYIFGDPSIMTPASSYFVDPENPLPERDVYDAACVLGCGPCPRT